jgi:ABC-2 type transport system ATP-binding protein
VPDAVVAEGLEKRFGETQALDGVHLSVAEGSIRGLLGPNGSGKTTTVRVLSTLLRPDAGRASIAGHDVLKDSDRVRAAIGLSGQFSATDGNLTGRENLRMIGRLYQLGRRESNRRADELLERLELEYAADRPARTYSGGMNRRLDLAAAIIGRAPVLFLDEPTTGLDPFSRRQIWDLVRSLVDEGTTLLLTTQYLEEADQLADQITVIDHGKVIAEGTANELKSRVGGNALELRLCNPTNREEAVRILTPLAADAHAVVDERDVAGTIEVPLGEDTELIAAAIHSLHEHQIAIEDVNVRRPSLDDVFLTLTGHAAAPDGAPEEHQEEVIR